MRKLIILTGALAALGGLAVMAQAEIVQTFSVSTPPAKAGKPIALNVNETTSDSAGAGVQTPPLRRQIVRLNKGGKYNPKVIAQCNKQTLLDTTKCPTSSKIGTGNATAVALPIVPIVHATLALYEGQTQNGHPTVYVYAVPDLGPNLLTIGEVFKKVSGAFDYNLDFKIDPIQTLPGAPDASVTSVNTKSGIKHKKIGKKTVYLIVAPKTCNGKWVGEAEFHYQITGQPEIVKTVQGSITCHK